jgi:hypothetical protein
MQPWRQIGGKSGRNDDSDSVLGGTLHSFEVCRFHLNGMVGQLVIVTVIRTYQGT